MTDLVLRPFSLADEAEAVAAQAELAADDFTFLLEDFGTRPWAEYLARLAEIERGENLATDRVPAALLAADVDGELVGRSSIRYELNDWLSKYGGHIGYGVRPAFRRRGYATEILRQSLVIVAERGVAQALVTCDDDNAASAATIERCGGVLEGLIEGEGAPKRRYWVPTYA